MPRFRLHDLSCSPMKSRTSELRMGKRGLRTWRTIAIVGVLVTVVATHWPRLKLSAEAPSDKMLHAVTYGVLTFIIWRAAWLARRWQLILAMVLFASLDEWTQSLPPFSRHTSWNDWTADLVGVAVCVFLLWCSLPARGPMGELRNAVRAASERRLFDRPFTWLAMATSAAVGALVGGAISVTVSRLLLDDARPLQTLFLGAVFFAAMGVDWTVRAGLRAMNKQIIDARLCLQCGGPITVVGESGGCSQCGRPWVRQQWVALPHLWSRDRGRLRLFLLWRGPRAAAVSFVVIGSLGIYAWAVLMLTEVWLGKDIAVPTDMRDLFAYAYAVAWIGLTVRLVRSAVASKQAIEGLECVSCGHLLRGVGVRDGVGMCPECGAEFIARPQADALRVPTRSSTA